MDDDRVHELRAAVWSLSKIATEVGCTVSEVISSLGRHQKQRRDVTFRQQHERCATFGPLLARLTEE
jgi:hypothetical protein